MHKQKTISSRAELDFDHLERIWSNIFLDKQFSKEETDARRKI